MMCIEGNGAGIVFAMYWGTFAVAVVAMLVGIGMFLIGSARQVLK